ncbi:ClpA/B family protein [Plesiocystis pacifica SIR-1]|uniref:ClpA/B family protein n=2 Tax=Plesiocystis pacifica TaxID=191768 RepID=A6GDL3_9BACT|nr:ClpA/B family protein [Plesiocystis pacifica SIR-1]
MSMDLSVSVFQRKVGNTSTWWSVGFGPHEIQHSGRNLTKLRDRFVSDCRERVKDTKPRALAELQLVRGRELALVQLDLTVRASAGKERFTGRVPLILEPRPVGPDRVLHIAYHPLRPREWFPYPADERGRLPELAQVVFQRAWSEAELLGPELDWLRTQGREHLRLVGFRGQPPTLLGSLERKSKGPEMARIGTRRRTAGVGLLHDLGTNLTHKAGQDELRPGMPREPYREQLRQLLCGERKAPVLLIGPPGVGKTTLLHRLVLDILDADGWAAHQNLDRVHHVWQISGRRIIAGMSYLGQWEKRCVELLEQTYAKKLLLYVDDVHAWGRIGESKQNDRCLADFFRGPLARGELTLVGECTPEQYQQLQADAGNFANAFTTVHVEPTDTATTMRMLVHEARALELTCGCSFDPRVYRSIYELSGSLYSGTAYPGKALELVRTLAARHRISPERIDRLLVDEVLMRAPKPKDRDSGREQVGTGELIALLSQRTGMPELLLSPERPLDAEAVAAAFAAQVMGQDQAVEVVRDLIVRIKAGLCDPSRPYGVFLFTGPTGTGKTEMAKALAEYLFGDESRLIRLDMSEYNVPHAAARLIGDRFQPQGVLTSAIRAQPFSVVLLDEVEKAAPSVLNLTLQLFDDGRLTDAAGEVADFRHAVLIMTSNLGAGGGSSMGFGGDAGARSRAVLLDISKAVREFFPPELFNRIDRVVQFHPLSPTAARAIARKELGRLLNRRGLLERNTFVRYTEAVLARVVDQGFNARDGARSLKRWLEDNIGSLLVDALTGSQAASMRLLWLYVGGVGGTDGARGRVQVHEEALREAEPIPEDSRFSEILEAPNAAVFALVPEALRFLRSLDSGEGLRRLSKTLASLLEDFNRQLTHEPEPDALDHGQAANALYNLEVLRTEITELRQALELHADYDARVADASTSPDRLGEQLEIDRYPSDSIQHPDGTVTRVTRLDRRQLSPDLPLRERRRMLEAIAGVWFLERAIDHADEASQHVVLLELSRVGNPRQRGRFGERASVLFHDLLAAYMDRGRGELESWAALCPEDEAHGGATTSARLAGNQAPASLREHLRARTPMTTAVLQLVGPSVRDFFAGESGSQLLEALSGEHEIVRVRVLPPGPRGVDTSPAAALQALVEQRERFVASLEGRTDGASAEKGEGLPPNPDAMLPLIRRYKLEDGRSGKPPVLEVEDYPLSHVSTHASASVTTILPLLWLLRVGVAMHARREEGAS